MEQGPARTEVGPAASKPRGTPPMAAELRLTGDVSLAIHDDGRTLIGGSPLTILRLSNAGAAAVAGWLDGKPVDPSATQMALARRLLEVGAAHPQWSAAPWAEAAAPAARRATARWADVVTAVVPVRDDPDGLAATLAALSASVGRIVVVDDGSRTPIDMAAEDERSARGAGALATVHVVRHDHSGGPAAARNTGVREVVTDVVAFVDAGVTPEPGWLDTLLPHFADERVVAVAPRIRSRSGTSALARYEQDNSPLDLGTEPAAVRPRTRVSYVPTACLLVRRVALGDAPFDEALRYGEDVDLIWRLSADGGVVRYEPAAATVHEPRPDLASFMRQRAAYASASAPLDARHPHAVVPVAVSAWSAAAWTLAAAGHPVVGLGVAAASTAMLPAKLGSLPDRGRRAIELAGRGHLAAGPQLLTGVRRHWAPAAIVGALLSRRVRRVAAAAAVAPLWEWYRTRPTEPANERMNAASWLGLRLVDDLSYAAGLWQGCLAHRRIGPLLPDLGSWPCRGRSPKTAPSPAISRRSRRRC